MAVNAEIITGDRRVIDFVLSPILRYRNESEREMPPRGRTDSISSENSTRPRKALVVATLLASLTFVTDARADTTACPTDQGTVAYAQCYGTEVAKARKELEQTFQQSLDKIPDRPPGEHEDVRNSPQELRKFLIASQDAWSKYIDASCALYGGSHGRGLWIYIFYADCVIRETRSRIDALRHLSVIF
jgi:uncharacterized protein YecT (DUF1311 family)